MSKRFRDDNEEVETLKLMRQACILPLSYLKQYVEDGADVRYVDEDGNTPLLLVAHLSPFKGKSETAQVIDYLCKKGAGIRVRNFIGESVLHRAVESADAEAVRYIIENAPDMVSSRRNDSLLPIDLAARRKIHDEELLVLIMEATLAREPAWFDSRSVVHLLHKVCSIGTAASLDALLRFAPQNLSLCGGLLYAGTNREHGVEVARCLLRHDPSLTFDQSFCRYPIESNSVALVEDLVELFPGLRVENAITPAASPDGNCFFVECLRAGRPWNAKCVSMKQIVEADNFKRDKNANSFWCALRAQENHDVNLIFDALREQENPKCWIYTINDQWLKGTNCTILHLACSSRKLSPKNRLQIVQRIAEESVNPFALDESRNLAIDLCPQDEPDTLTFLRGYQQWSWTPMKMRWFGPHFLERTMTLMLCMNRNGLVHTRDIRELLMKELASVEHPYA